MELLTQTEIKKAFYFWSYEKGYRELDDRIQPFLSENILAFGKHPGWLKDVRKSLQLTNQQVSEKLEGTKSGYSKLEKSECDGNITLKTLAKVAEAMDCELVYALRPKQKVPFSLIVWKQILPRALRHPWITKCDSKRKAEALAAIARRLMRDSQFRRDQGWSQRIRD